MFVDTITLERLNQFDWISFCREVVTDYLEYSSKPLRGPGKTVEIHEAKFGKIKHLPLASPIFTHSRWSYIDRKCN